MDKNRSGAILATLLMALGLISCSSSIKPASSGGPTDSASPAGNIIPAAQPRFLLPLDAYYISDDQMNILHGALAKLVRQCMDRAGILMPTAPPVSQGIPKNERRYGLSDPRKAASYGYHLAPEEKPIPDNQKLSKDQQKALAGTQNGKTGPGGSPPEGCTANAANQITGTPYYPSDALIVRQLSVDSFDNSKQDPRVVSVIDEWAMCMKGKGFPYSSPLESVNVMTRDDEPSTEEISVARADVTCKESTNLIQVWLAVESEIQNRLIGQHESELNAATLEINEMVGRATEVMSQNR